MLLYNYRYIMVLHIAIGIIGCNFYPILFSYISIAMLLFGFMNIINKNLENVILSFCYIGTLSIILRIYKLGIFWEYDKYSITLLAILALLRFPRIFKNSNKSYFLFLLCLLPSILVYEASFETLRFYMSGSISLGICLLFFSGIKNINIDVRKVFLTFLFPIVSLSIVLIITTYTNYNQIHWGMSSVSNKITSAGYGPNQVSLILGFGVLVSTIMFFKSNNKYIKLVFIFLVFIFSIQSALTWSRGGLFCGLIGSSIIILGKMFSKNSSIKNVLVIIIISIIFNFTFDKADYYTKGALYKRINYESTTGRYEMLIADLVVFKNNILLGAGVGRSTFFHDITGYHRKAGSHTYFSRLLAEHGIFGLIALSILLISFFEILRSQNYLAISLASWSILSMSHNDIRLVLPALIFSLCQVIKNNRIK